MSNSPMSEALKVKPITAGRWLVVCLVMSVFASSMGHAQLTTPTTSTETREIRSGLYLVAPRHYPSITVSDAGSATTLFPVRIEFRDPTGRVVAAVNGEAGRGKPVRLRPQNLVSGNWQEVSATVRYTLADPGNAVMTVFEDIGPDAFLARVIVCGPGALGGGGQQMCQGWNETIPDPPQ